MRVLYLHSDWYNRRKRYGEMVSNLGHHVDYYPLSKRATIPDDVDLIEKYRPDMILIRLPETVDNNLEKIRNYRKRGVPVLFYGTWTPNWPYSEMLDVWKEIDYAFIHNTECVNYLRGEGINAHFLPLGFYRDQYFPTKSKKIINVSFAGGVRLPADPTEERRIRYLNALVDYNPHAFGEKFEGCLNTRIPVTAYGTHEQQRHIYAASKINLDFPTLPPEHEWCKDMFHLKNRFFEVPATGNFLLTLRTPEALSLFDEDTVGYYDDDEASLCDAVEKYLMDEDLREKMSEKAYKVTWEKHTYEHRFEEMFKIIKK